MDLGWEAGGRQASVIKVKLLNILNYNIPEKAELRSAELYRATNGARKRHAPVNEGHPTP